MSDILIGKKLGDYLIQDLLGRGGMAHVYRGFDPNLQRYSAVKVIDSRLLAKGHEAEYRERFRREARAIAKLTQPNIVGVYQFGEYGPLYYMAMEFIDGQDLHLVMKLKANSSERLNYSEIYGVVRDIGAALDYAHVNGVIHRDVKPSNIMMKPDGRAVLTDFGLALDVPEGTGGNTFGSAHYIAPEQAISSRNAVPQSDLYSLGVVLYQMCTGKVPFDDSSAMSVALKHLSEAPPPPRMVDSSISPAVEKVILRALEKEPSKRFKAGAAMTQALQEALGLTEALGGSRPSRLLPPTAPGPVATGKRSTREMQALNADLSTFEADSNVSEARKTILLAQEAQARGRSRPIILVGAVVAAVAVAIGLLAFAALGNPSGDTTPSPAAVAAASSTGVSAAGSTTRTQPSVAGGAEIETASPTPTSTVQPSETLTPTQTLTPSATLVPSRPPTLTPTPEATGAALVAPPASDTPAPSETPAEPPTESPTPASPPSDDIVLRYDPEVLVLQNVSGGPLNVRSLAFERDGNNGKVQYFATSWETVYLDRLPNNDCLMLWPIRIDYRAAPDYCLSQRAWFGVGQFRSFWIAADAPDATFAVLFQNRPVAVCPVNEGTCAFSLDGG